MTINPSGKQLSSTQINKLPILHSQFNKDKTPHDAHLMPLPRLAREQIPVMMKDQ
jgi:hypothetical protein